MTNAEAEFVDPFDPNDVASNESALKEHSGKEQAVQSQILRDRQEAYRRLFSGAGAANDVRIVMEDLRAFCRGDQSTYNDNPRTHALLTGRQEVYYRIKDHTTLHFEEMLEKYS